MPDETQATFDLSIGQLLWLNYKINIDHVRFKPVFWGEHDSSIYLRAQNTSDNEKFLAKHKAQYDVRYAV
jgi:hypothetical protein